MKRTFQFRLWWLAAVALAEIATPSTTLACAGAVPARQCQCVYRPLDATVREYLTAENGVPVPFGGRNNVIVTTRYFILGTMMDPRQPVPAAEQFLFPEMHRFRVDASWARSPVGREIGRTINVSALHIICDPPRYRIGQQYLLYVGFAGDTLINMIPCGTVHASDSAKTRAAIALLDSSLKRR